MTSFLVFLISQTIFLPLITGLVRWRRIGQGYQPFFIVIFLAVLAENLDYYLIKIRHHSNAVPSNVYALAESLLILWQFYVWGLWRTRKPVFYGLIALLCLVWTTENLVLGHITDFPPYFKFLESFLVVLLSVNKINFMITHDNRKLLRRPDFLFCIGFIIFFIYKIVYEWAYQVSLYDESRITNTIIASFSYINALTNIIFAIAFLLIPVPQKFTLRASPAEN
ncbi:MAG: hypothetical protein JST42_05065 [Bacteroidetes bacterium]|nr:hypothetical protein [Bacteroidota bacterium]